jgi:hypothetical protein
VLPFNGIMKHGRAAARKRITVAIGMLRWSVNVMGELEL